MRAQSCEPDIPLVSATSGLDQTVLSHLNQGMQESFGVSSSKNRKGTGVELYFRMKVGSKSAATPNGSGGIKMIMEAMS